MNWKAVGLESGKIYATGTHADCSRAVNEGISNIDERANAAITHTEAIRVMREDEYIRSNEEELELIEEKMRQTKLKKHRQLEVKKIRLEKEREQKRLDAEQEEIANQVAIAKIQAMRDAAKREEAARKAAISKIKAAEKKVKAKEPKQVIEKRVYANEWTEEQDAYLKTNIQEANETLIVTFRERFGKELTDSALDNRKYKLRKQYGIPSQKSRATWTDADDEYLISNYHRMTAEEIGEHLGGRKRAAIWNRAEKLKAAGRLANERYDKTVDYFIQRGADEMKQENAVERAEKMDTTQIIKPEKGDKTAMHMMICKQLNQTYQAKNTDYGDSFGETYRKLGIISAVTRISDKTNRLINLAGKPEAERRVKDETLQDTLMDLANYALLTLIELEEAR